MSNRETSPDEFLRQLPTVQALQTQIQRNREESKVLRRMLKLAAERDALATSQQEAAQCK